MKTNNQQTTNVSLWRTFFRTIKFSTENRLLFSLSLLFAFLMTTFDLLIPYIFSRFFNYAQSTVTTGAGLGKTFFLLGAAYLAVSISASINQALNSYYGYEWWLRTQKNVFLKSYNHINTLSLNFFEKNPTGKIRERVWNGSQAITNILDDTFFTLLPQLLFVISSIVILFFIKPIFSISLLLLTPLYIFILYRFNHKLEPLRKASRVKWEALSTKITESIYNIRTIKTNAREAYHFGNVTDSAEQALGNEMDWAKINSLSRLVFGAIISVAKVLILVYAFYLVIQGNIQIGTLILIWSYVNRSLDPIFTMVRNITEVQKNLVDTQLTYDYLDSHPEILDSKDAVNRHFKHPSIGFNHINFGYKEVVNINDFSLKIPGGSTVAIVGKSGSGKSTLVKLLLRLYDVNKGNILIDKTDITHLFQKSLRDNISVVMQDSVIFNDTAYNNIRYTKLNAKRTEIENAAKLAGATNFIAKLPKGYNTVLGEKGVKLSGGEQQRINIARAFLKNAPILILDEATSSLDSEIEQEIQDAMWKLAKDRTTIIIAHRLSTVMKADLIVVMDKGKIVETGTHKDLVEQKGIYARLFEIQSGGYLK